MAKEVPTFQRTETVEAKTSAPQFTQAFEKLATTSNLMGDIGARVAQQSSQALATTWGTEAGQKPHGNLFPAVTDFDRQFEASYKTQSQAVLSLQAEKLFADSQLQLAKASRLTPELIQQTNSQVSMGLARIASQAPNGVKENLQANFASQMISNNLQYQKHMITQQREDQKNNVLAGLDLNDKNLYNLATTGDYKGAESYVDQSKKMIASAVASNFITKQDGQKRTDSIDQTYLNGKTVHQAVQAQSEGKYGEWAKRFSTNPDKLPLDKFRNAGNAAAEQINFLHGLNVQNDQFLAAQMRTSITKDASGITDGNWSNFESNVFDKTLVEKVRKEYEHAINSANKVKKETQDIIGNFSDSAAFARSTPKQINDAFDKLVNYTMDTSKKKGPEISRDDAQVQVAASAGGRVPVFEKELDDKLTSGNPNNILSASKQIQALQKMEASRAYQGVSQLAKAVGIQFNQQRGSMPDNDLARKITDNLSNIDNTMETTLNNSWNIELSKAGAAGVNASKSLFNFALDKVDLGERSGMFGIGGPDLGGTYFKVIYGNDIYNQLKSNFLTTRGDFKSAVELTKDYVKDHYGETYINGKKQITDNPIEKYLGYKGNEITPYVQADLLNQLSVEFESNNSSHPSDQWKTLPLKNGKVEVMRTVETDKGKKEFRYPVSLVGRPGNQWDIAVETPRGLRNLFLIAPQFGLTTYEPDKDVIVDDFLSNKRKEMVVP